MRRLLLIIAGLSVATCASPFPIRTCMQAKQSVSEACGFAGVAEWTCWNEPTLRGTGTVLPDGLFVCLDGATTCFEVESCLRNQGMLPEPSPPVGDTANKP